MRGSLALAQDLSRTVPLACAIGGLNATDSISSMPPLDAYVLDNLIPRQTSLELRGGYSVQSSSLGSSVVEALAEYSSGTTNKLIGCANGRIYDATTTGGTATSLASGFANNRWQTIIRGSKLLFFNGADTPQQYDGTNVTAATYTGPSTPAEFIHPNVYRSRLYLVRTNSLKYAYSNVDAITGALVEIDISGLCSKGGYILWTATWTKDGGNGSDDYFVIMTSKGECLVYEGSYPDGADWNKVGTYQVSEPAGRRSVIKIGGDLLVVCSDGIVPLSTLLTLSFVPDPAVKVSKKISPLFKSLIKTYGTNFGWQPIIYKNAYLLIVNVPVNPGGQYVQYVCNLQTGSWCRFTGYNSVCWSEYAGNIYFGGTDGKVYRADNTLNDNGAPISFECRQAYNNFGVGQNKLFNMLRPVYASAVGITFLADVDVDFKSAPIGNPVTSTGLGTPWGSPWSSPWSSDSTIYNDWSTVGGYGVYGSVRFKGSIKSSTLNLYATDVCYEPGGIL